MSSFEFDLVIKGIEIIIGEIIIGNTRVVIEVIIMGIMIGIMI